MSEFEKQDDDLFRMMREARRRNGTTAHLGYFVTDEQFNSRNRADTPLLILSGILLVVTLAVSLAAVLV